MPMTRWNFKHEDPSSQHIGPITQDFHALFGLNGPNDTMLSPIDPSGVALAGVQALSHKLTRLETTTTETIRHLTAEVDALKAEVAALKTQRSSSE
ncbi:MAG: hypothetical protein HYZ89_08535 [Candidatus Omnitrophica bacterium]|nr:hypothetical protein [Candidatus Omnitrophota bacterium]